MYLQRNYSTLAKRYLSNFPVLCLVGPRQAGKTCFAKNLAPNWKYLDLEKPSDFELITNVPEHFFEQYAKNVIIDEVQEYPKLFKILRGVIDADRTQKGRFILTGSSSPEITAHISDSLAGRVGIIQIDPLKANEFYQTPFSNFYDIFATAYKKEDLHLDLPAISNLQIRHCWLYGGYPEPMLLQDITAYNDWMSNYHATYVNRDIAKLFPRLNKIAYQRFIKTLSFLSGNVLNKADLARAIEISEKSITEYLYIAEQTFIWRNISYDVNSAVKSLIKRSKGLLMDSGLQNYLQKINNYEQLLSSPNSGRSFESFVISEIIRGIAAVGISNVDYHFYRTAKGAEVDLIVTTPSCHIPIEIKMAKTVPIKKLAALNKYIEDNNLPFGLLINQSDHIVWVTEKILQVPVGVL